MTRETPEKRQERLARQAERKRATAEKLAGERAYERAQIAGYRILVWWLAQRRSETELLPEGWSIRAPTTEVLDGLPVSVFHAKGGLGRWDWPSPVVPHLVAVGREGYDEAIVVRLSDGSYEAFAVGVAEFNRQANERSYAAESRTALATLPNPSPEMVADLVHECSPECATKGHVRDNQDRCHWCGISVDEDGSVLEDFRL